MTFEIRHGANINRSIYLDMLYNSSGFTSARPHLVLRTGPREDRSITTLVRRRTAKRLTSLFGLIALCMSSPCLGTAQTTWQLVWSDEFNGVANTVPDSSKWAYDTGGGGWGNNEEEIYCAAGSNASPCTTATPNAYQDGNGNLIIQAVNSGGTWTSARMRTYPLVQFQYGRIEARMKLPMGAGIWPAFWLLGQNFNDATWPLCGEMDIMEWVPQYGPNKTSSTIHGPLSGGNGVGSQFTFPNGGRVDDAGFHTYGVTWSPNQAQFYRDDPTTPYFTITKSTDISGDWVFNHPFFVILNLAIGGYFPGYSDASTPSPSVLSVDYVRVYRAANSLVTGPVAINAGGDSEGSFFADTNFTGGITSTTTAAVDTSLIPAPAPPQAIYQTAREGSSKYTVTGLIPAATYNVQLHFAETTWSSPGQRQFNVSLNNKNVLTNFDIFAATGAKNKAIQESFTATADPLSGGIMVNLTPGASGQPTISGIAVTPVGTATTSGRVFINAGAGDVGNFVSDVDYSGGTIANTSSAIDTSLIAAPVPPQAVFQSERYGNSTYTVGGFVPGTTHTVTLYFAEIYWTASGKRQFNVLINGNQVLTNFDIFASTGAEDKAIQQQFTATANSSGQIVIQFTVGSADQPKVSGIQVN